MRTRSALIASILFLGGCVTSFDPAGDPDDGAGVVTAELGPAPGGVRCVRVRTRGTEGELVSDDRVNAMPGAPVALSIANLPEGELAFRGEAYDLACASVTDATRATWESDEVPFDVSHHRAQSLELVLRPVRATGVDVTFEGNVVDFAVSHSTSYAVYDDGTVRAAGGNAIGASALTEVRQIAVGMNHRCAIRGEPAQVVCWGNNSQGQCGTGSGLPRHDTPTVVNVPGTPRQIVAAANHTCVVTRHGGSLYCWGQDSHGQLGGAAGSVRTTPTHVGMAGTIDEVATNETHTCVQSSTGDVRCAGLNTNGQLGLGHTNAVTGFQYVQGLNGVRSIAVSETASYAMQVDGRVRAWGWDGRTYGATPVDVPVPAPAQQIAAGEFHVCVRNEGRVWCWGSNVSGSVGVGSAAGTINQPTEVLLPLPALGIDGGPGRNGCALLEDGSAWCWGENSNDHLGVGSEESQWSPVEVSWVR